MNRRSCCRAALRGRVVVGLVAAAMVGGVSMLAGAAGKSAPVGMKRSVVKRAQPARLVAQINAQLGLTKSDVIRVDTARLAAGRAGQAVMKIREQMYTVDLAVHSARADNYRVYTMNGDGPKVEIEPGPVNTYRGTLAEAPGAVVAASLMSDGLHGNVQFPDGEIYWFEGLGDRLGGGPGTDGLHVVYNDADVIPSGGTCACEEAPLARAHEHLKPAGTPRMAQGGGPLIAEVAVDADTRFISRWTSETENRINAIFNAVNTQYLRDVNVVHEIVAVVLHETDPAAYTSNDPSTLLTQFRLHWIDEHSDIERDVAHLFTGRNLSGSVIGIAWLGVICDSVQNGLGFGLVQSDCCGSLACASDLSAHELGHNWNADHCSCTSWTMNPSLQCSGRFNPDFTIPGMLSYIAGRNCLASIAPANNNCDDATNIGDGSFAYTTVDSTTDGGLSDCGSISKDIWYTYAASCDGLATATLCGSDFNTRIGIYDPGDCAGTPFACNDDACDTQSEVTWPVTAGATYLVRVGGRSAEGSGTLVLSCGEAPLCPNDVDGSGDIGFADVLAILTAWGDAGGPADVNGDGTVGDADILAVLSDWGTACP